jgi:hypothetical protein
VRVPPGVLIYPLWHKGSRPVGAKVTGPWPQTAPVTATDVGMALAKRPSCWMGEGHLPYAWSPQDHAPLGQRTPPFLRERQKHSRTTVRIDEGPLLVTMGSEASMA